MTEHDPGEFAATPRAGEGREIELKLAVPAGDLDAVRRHPLLRRLAQGRPSVQRLHTVYYDTPDRDLARARLALRLRREGGRTIQALKGTGTSIGGLFVRGEWEADVEGDVPDLSRIPSFAAQALARRAIGTATLEPVFETDFERTRFAVVRGDTELRLDVDEGEIRAKGRSAPIREVELELVKGDPGVLHGLALELHETVPVRPALESKAERGHALATGRRPVPRRAAHPELARDATLEGALRAVVAAGLEQVLANLEPAREPGDDGEGVHQLRVGLRRTRAALAFFRGVLPVEQAEAFKGELRFLAGEVGPARDLDVFLAETLEPLAARFPDDAALKRLRDGARELRDDAYVRARAALDAPRTAALCLALGGWLAGAAYRAGGPEGAREALSAPAAPQVAARLDARLEKTRKRGKHIARRTAAERHALRIELKKLRYASDSLATLFERDAERWLERVAALQDTLGALNDVAMTEKLTAELAGKLGREWGAPHERAAGFLVGWSTQAAERRLRRLESQAKAFRSARPFWRS
jgi:inorganic triphosphatase YgiF